MARTSQNSRKPSCKSTNSGSFAGVMDMARERPVAAAAAAAGAAAAGVFLWSKRNQISDQLSQLSDQIGEWTDQMGSDRANPQLETVGGDTTIRTRTKRRNRSTTGTGRRSAGNGSSLNASNEGSPIA